MPQVHQELSGELHVQPHPHTGGWLVGPCSDRAEPSWHATVNEAERAASREAAISGRRRILIHDRYARVRAITPRAGSRT
jgi:hypothetical protein